MQPNIFNFFSFQRVYCNDKELQPKGEKKIKELLKKLVLNDDPKETNSNKFVEKSFGTH